MKKAQVSVEFLTIFGFVFLMTIPLIIIFFDQSGYVQDTIASNHLRNLAIKITDKAEIVYYLGNPSKTTLRAYFPSGLDSIEFVERTVIINYTTRSNVPQTITYTGLVNMTGNVSAKSGIHHIEITATGDAVSVEG